LEIFATEIGAHANLLMMKLRRLVFFCALAFTVAMRADDPKLAGEDEITVEAKIIQHTKKPGTQNEADTLSAPKIILLDGQLGQIRVTSDKSIALEGHADVKQEYETGIVLNVSTSIDGDHLVVCGVLELSEPEGKPHPVTGGAQWIEVHVTRVPFVAQAQSGKPFEITFANPSDAHSTLNVQFTATRSPKPAAVPAEKQ
jgi:hypothetical protein